MYCWRGQKRGCLPKVQALDPENRTRQNWENARGPQFGRFPSAGLWQIQKGHCPFFKAGHAWNRGVGGVMILWMEEILHHLGWLNPPKNHGIDHPINWRWLLRRPCPAPGAVWRRLQRCQGLWETQVWCLECRGTQICYFCKIPEVRHGLDAGAQRERERERYIYVCVCVVGANFFGWWITRGAPQQSQYGFNASREIFQPSRNATLYDIDTPILSQLGIWFSNIFNDWERNSCSWSNFCQFAGVPSFLCALQLSCFHSQEKICIYCR